MVGNIVANLDQELRQALELRVFTLGEFHKAVPLGAHAGKCLLCSQASVFEVLILKYSVRGGGLHGLQHLLDQSDRHPADVDLHAVKLAIVWIDRCWVVRPASSQLLDHPLKALEVVVRQCQGQHEGAGWIVTISMENRWIVRREISQVEIRTQRHITTYSLSPQLLSNS